MSLSIEAGDGLALLGPNGSGKTTLLRILAGLLRPSEGSVTLSLAGQDIPRADRIRITGYMGHDTYLYDDLTGYENLEFWMRFSRPRTSRLQTAEALDAVGMTPAASSRVKTYSAGMKRRLCLAMLLLTQPAVLMVDEPHASLDAEARNLVDGVVRSARESGRLVIISSHEQGRVLDLCNRAVLLDSGRVAFSGSREELTDRNGLRLLGNG